MKIGVITKYELEFINYKKNNPCFECYWINKVFRLQDHVYDYFVRLDGWKKVDKNILNVVAAQELLRGLVKEESVKENKWYSGVITGKHATFITKDDPWPVHPQCKTVVWPDPNFNRLFDMDLKLSGEAMQRSLDSLRKSGVSITDETRKAKDRIDARGLQCHNLGLLR